MSLDELVAARKINADQKAQILKKPSLQASLTQLEEQIAQYKKFDQEYKARSQVEKAEFEKSFTDRANKELEEKVAAAKKDAVFSAEQDQRAALLLLSQFLRLAAIRRGDEEADVSLDENKALEGVLSQVYSGDLKAVDAMVNLIQGSEKTTTSIASEPLKTTCQFSLNLHAWHFC
jgi:dynactin complex subunit